MTAVYLFRVIERSCFAEGPDPAHPRGLLRELPAGMLAPIVLLAVSTLLIGILNQSIVTHVIAFALPVPGGR
jgi:NADH:ubiquinone oxidoreductase subunit 5 (subunit L)/multisubunit Na+/H+ antiporter MnhA subunit